MRIPVQPLIPTSSWTGCFNIPELLKHVNLHGQVYIIKRSTLADVKNGLKGLECQLRKELGFKNYLLFAITLDVQKSCKDSKENSLYIL